MVELFNKYADRGSSSNITFDFRNSISLNLIWCTYFHADLRTMSKRIDSEQYYVTFEMFFADVKRMFANARTYNSPDTIYYKCATRCVNYAKSYIFIIGTHIITWRCTSLISASKLVFLSPFLSTQAWDLFYKQSAGTVSPNSQQELVRSTKKSFPGWIWKSL